MKNQAKKAVKKPDGMQQNNIELADIGKLAQDKKIRQAQKALADYYAGYLFEHMDDRPDNSENYEKALAGIAADPEHAANVLAAIEKMRANGATTHRALVNFICQSPPFAKVFAEEKGWPEKNSRHFNLSRLIDLNTAIRHIMDFAGNANAPRQRDKVSVTAAINNGLLSNSASGNSALRHNPDNDNNKKEESWQLRLRFHK
jgi:hypothetical protein